MIDDDNAVRQLEMLQDSLRRVNLQLFDEWKRVHRNRPFIGLNRQEAVLLYRIITTLQECEREVAYLQQVNADHSRCVNCGKRVCTQQDEAHGDGNQAQGNGNHAQGNGNRACGHGNRARARR